MQITMLINCCVVSLPVLIVLIVGCVTKQIWWRVFWRPVGWNLGVSWSACHFS